jgi:hypothetical protein
MVFMDGDGDRVVHGWDYWLPLFLPGVGIGEFLALYFFGVDLILYRGRL